MLLPVSQYDLQTQPRESFIFQELAELALALENISGTIQPSLFRMANHAPPCASLYLEESFYSIYHATVCFLVYIPESTN